MADMVLGPETTVELVRAMRSLGHPPDPSYIADLAQTVGDILIDLEPEPNGRFVFEIFSPPLSIKFSLSADDFEALPEDESEDNRLRRRKKVKAIFSMLDHDTETPTIADKGRVIVRVASPREINAEGLDIWNEYVTEIEAGEWVHHELKPKFRSYILDIEEQIGYRIAFGRVTPFAKGDVSVPALANKKIMIVSFDLLTIDGEPVAVSEDMPARTCRLDANGCADPEDYEQMFQRTLDRAFSGKHVSFATNKTDQIKNADLLTRNKRFNANDFPLFFEDLVRFEVLGEKAERCKSSLPRAKTPRN